jgi:hypothetical protein
VAGRPVCALPWGTGGLERAVLYGPSGTAAVSADDGEGGGLVWYCNGYTSRSDLCSMQLQVFMWCSAQLGNSWDTGSAAACHQYATSSASNSVLVWFVGQCAGMQLCSVRGAVRMA